MGELLRRYWHPIAPLLELRERRLMPVRLLGEDLLLFLTAGGDAHLVSRRCPHRGADLAGGWVEGELIRCAYHGWAFNGAGHCLELPFEQASGESPLRERIGLRSYQVQCLGGMVWAYLGPRPAPLLPDFEPFSWRHGFVEVIISELPCNWFQCHENGVDPVHFEWLHTNQTGVRNRSDSAVYSPPHQSIDFDEFAFGYICGREVAPASTIADGPTSRTSRTEDGGVLCIWPNALMTGPTFEYRVPIDNLNTLNVTWQYTPFPQDAPPPLQQEIPYWYGPVEQSGKLITSHVLNQDFAAWIGQGRIADRRAEHLGRTDAGINMLRRRFLRELDRVAAGEDPPGLVRDPAHNQAIPLPIRSKSRYLEGLDQQAFERELAMHREWTGSDSGFQSVQAGRPAHVQALYEVALAQATAARSTPPRHTHNVATT